MPGVQPLRLGLAVWTRGIGDDVELGWTRWFEYSEDIHDISLFYNFAMSKKSQEWINYVLAGI
eukprot:scaffold1387_cov260-Pinguiococcus_pyrenoidosus.AAC.22